MTQQQDDTPKPAVEITYPEDAVVLDLGDGLTLAFWPIEDPTGIEPQVSLVLGVDGNLTIKFPEEETDGNSR